MYTGIGTNTMQMGTMMGQPNMMGNPNMMQQKDNTPMKIVILLCLVIVGGFLALDIQSKKTTQNAEKAEPGSEEGFQSLSVMSTEETIVSTQATKYIDVPYYTVDDNLSVVGDTIIPAETLAGFLLKYNKNPRLNGYSAVEIAQAFITEGKRENIRGDVAFCQSIKETGWFDYAGDTGGIVKSTMNNYSGLGALNNNAHGDAAIFATPTLGARAQIQHLKGYASTTPPITAIVDPRYSILQQSGLLGVAPKWVNLGGRWAWPGYDKNKYNSLEEAFAQRQTYGHKIIDIFKNLVEYSKANPVVDTDSGNDNSGNDDSGSTSGGDRTIEKDGKCYVEVSCNGDGSNMTGTQDLYNTVGPFTREEVIQRAKYWVQKAPSAHKLSNGASPRFLGYRVDTSGFASYALGLPKAPYTNDGVTTTELTKIYAESCTVDTLQPGDLLIRPGTSEQSGFVIIFESWSKPNTEYNLMYISPSDATAIRRTFEYPFIKNPETGKYWVEGLQPYCIKAKYFD